MAKGNSVKSVVTMTLLSAVVIGTSAHATERWAAIDGDAAAQLPPPTRTETVTAGKLACAEKRWRLDLTLSPGTVGVDGPRYARLRIGSDRFELDADRNNLIVSVGIPGHALPPLRSGIRANIVITGGSVDHRARFSLVGSRRTIDEIAPRCSNPDMSAYNTVVPGELNPETVLARELLRDEIKAFRAATRSAPAVAAAMQDVGDDRRLLFATLCGSSWYYGNSGCNMTVHAQNGSREWMRVYETEGVAMHVDPKANFQGWPNLVALTFDGEEVVWRWMDGEYQPPITEELRGG